MQFCGISALSIAAQQFASFLHHIAAALRTEGGGGFLPGHKIAFRVILAAEVFSALFRLFDDHLPAAFGAGHAYFLKIGLGILTVRKAGTGQKFAVRTILDHHVAAALITDLIRNLICYGDCLQLCLRLLNRLVQIRIKVADYGLPLNGSVSYPV